LDEAAHEQRRWELLRVATGLGDQGTMLMRTATCSIAGGMADRSGARSLF
jgi:hypothetical protein